MSVRRKSEGPAGRCRGGKTVRREQLRIARLSEDAKQQRNKRIFKTITKRTFQKQQQQKYLTYITEALGERTTASETCLSATITFHR